MGPCRSKVTVFNIQMVFVSSSYSPAIDCPFDFTRNSRRLKSLGSKPNFFIVSSERPKRCEKSSRASLSLVNFSISAWPTTAFLIGPRRGKPLSSLAKSKTLSTERNSSLPSSAVILTSAGLSLRSLRATSARLSGCTGAGLGGAAGSTCWQTAKTVATSRERAALVQRTSDMDTPKRRLYSDSQGIQAQIESQTDARHYLRNCRTARRGSLIASMQVSPERPTNLHS